MLRNYLETMMKEELTNVDHITHVHIRIKLQKLTRYEAIRHNSTTKLN